MREEQVAISEIRATLATAESGLAEPAPIGDDEDRGPRPRTTALEGHSCGHCGLPLTGRKERFCSDKCRMRDRRADQTRRVAAWLGEMEKALAGLKDEFPDETQVER